jgi:hypothetical protein
MRRKRNKRRRWRRRRRRRKKKKKGSSSSSSSRIRRKIIKREEENAYSGVTISNSDWRHSALTQKTFTDTIHTTCRRFGPRKAASSGVYGKRYHSALLSLIMRQFKTTGSHNLRLTFYFKTGYDCDLIESSQIISPLTQLTLHNINN